MICNYRSKKLGNVWLLMKYDKNNIFIIRSDYMEVKIQRIKSWVRYNWWITYCGISWPSEPAETRIRKRAKHDNKIKLKNVLIEVNNQEISL